MCGTDSKSDKSISVHLNLNLFANPRTTSSSQQVLTTILLNTTGFSFSAATKFNISFFSDLICFKN